MERLKLNYLNFLIFLNKAQLLFSLLSILVKQKYVSDHTNWFLIITVNRCFLFPFIDTELKAKPQNSDQASYFLAARLNKRV